MIEIDELPVHVQLVYVDGKATLKHSHGRRSVQGDLINQRVKDFIEQERHDETDGS